MSDGCSLRCRCEEPLRRSNPGSFRGGSLDCFAALAMTVGGVAAFSALVSRTSCNAHSASKTRVNALMALRRRAGTQEPHISLLHGPRLCSAPPKGRCAASGARELYPSRIPIQISRGFAFSRPVRPELCDPFRPQKCRGRREGRVPAGTRGPLCESVCLKSCTAAYRCSQTSGLPCAVGLRLMSCSPRGAMHYCPRRLADG
ncbi:hypothetical protein ABIA00_000843 [Bradyrhizobium ottawaense]